MICRASPRALSAFGGITTLAILVGALLGGAFAPQAPAPTFVPEAVLLAAGDIARCDDTGDEATAALLAATPGTIAALGDLAYNRASAEEYAACYTPSWGQFADRTRPTPGNHEYFADAHAAPYFDYFGAAAGEPDKGYYSYDLGSWHVVVLNSNCARVGGCGADSAQAAWLRSDLQQHPARCTLAYWHHPLFSSGPHGNTESMRPLWQVLYDAGAEVVLNGHAHLYERFAPQTPDGSADPARGIREFVVGTGGGELYAIENASPNSEVRNNETWGILKLTLRATGYDWQFLAVDGATFTDAGSASCHG